jgi:hypothetical protein
MKIQSFVKNKLFLLFGVAFFSHGLLLLMDGIYWDCYILFDMLRTNDFSRLFIWMREMGFIFSGPAFLHMAVKLTFGNHFIFGYRLLAFLCIYLSGVLLFKIISRLKIMDEWSAFFVAALSILYPMQRAAFLGVILPYLFCLLLFLAATYITINKVFDGLKATNIRSIAWRILSLLLFLVSFYTNSILFFYFGFLFLLYLVSPENGINYLIKIKSFIINKADYVLIPFVFFSVQKSLFASYGYYSDYNQFAAMSFRHLLGILYSLFYGIYFSIGPIFSFINSRISFAVIVLYIAFILWQGFARKKISREMFFLAFSCCLLFLAIFPYAAVGKGWGKYYGSRHLLLAGIPVSLILFSLIEDFTRRLSLSRVIRTSVYIVLIVIFTVGHINNYIDWQFRWIKDKAVMLKLSEMPAAKKFSTFYIKNNTFDSREAGIYQYDVYEWSTIFKSIWGGEKRIGYDVNNYSREVPKEYYTRFYNLADYDPKGLKADLTINYPKGGQVRTGRAKIERVLVYYYYGMFKRAEKDKYLKGLIDIKVTARSRS